MEPLIDKRPWGQFKQFTHNEPTTVKILTVEPHQELSLQYHEHRKEFWKVLSGSGVIQIEDEHIAVKKGDEFTILEKRKHRVSAESEQLEVLEISYGEFDENDIIRLEDKYGRAHK